MARVETEEIEVEVVYAREDVQTVVQLRVPQGTTVRRAIENSGVLDEFSGIDLACNAVGVYGTVCELDDSLVAGDRVEIYRPLRADPKIARRRRAAK